MKKYIMYTLHYAPKTRSFTALWLLEELGVQYQLNALDLQAGDLRTGAHLAVNPMGKVPALSFPGGALAETGAISVFLADRHPEAKLAPALDSPRRGTFLQWCFFGGSVIEPSLGEKFFKWNVPDTSVAWGSFERMLKAFHAGLAGNDWLVGNEFSVADVVVGAGLRFGVLFGAIDDPIVKSYVDRLSGRPAFLQADKIEQSYY